MGKRTMLERIDATRTGILKALKAVALLLEDLAIVVAGVLGAAVTVIMILATVPVLMLYGAFMAAIEAVRATFRCAMKALDE